MSRLALFLLVVAACAVAPAQCKHSSTSEEYEAMSFAWARAFWYSPYGVLGFQATLGTAVKESVTSGTVACSPVFYPGGYSMSAYIPPSGVAGANAPIEMKFVTIPSPHSPEFSPKKGELPVVSKPPSRSAGFAYEVYAGEGATACVFYEGTDTITFDVYVSLMPSRRGVVLYAALLFCIGIGFAVLAYRVALSWHNTDKIVAPESAVGSMFLGTYFPGIDLPAHHVRMIELIVFMAALPFVCLPPGNTPYMQQSLNSWPNDNPMYGSEYVTRAFIPLPVWPTVLLIIGTPLAQLIVGVIFAFASKHLKSSLMYAVYWLAMLTALLFTLFLLPGGYDYRIQALMTRALITLFCSQAIWLFVVRPVLSRYTIVSGDGQYGRETYAEVI